MTVTMEPTGTTPVLANLVGRFLLHEGTHAQAESSNTVGMEYVAASVAFVGIVGGLLYWYFGRVDAP